MLNFILAFRIGFFNLGFVDILDILLVAFLFFRLYKMLKGGVGLPIFIGMLSLYLLYLTVKSAQMEMLTIILGQVMGVGVVATIIVFQQEVRRFLIMIGKTAFIDKKWLQYLPWYKTDQEDIMDVTPIVEASKTLSSTKTGGLMVLTMMDGLSFYIESGDIIDAQMSKRLLISIFNKESPLHDGAVIIQNGRITSARSILPVTQKDDLPASMGLRHRAAYGLSEETDALIVIVSEETGQISLVRKQKIHENISAMELRGLLRKYLTELKGSLEVKKEGEENEDKDESADSTSEKTSD